jgi:hypothetical protein
MDFMLKSKRNELTSKLMLSGSDGLSKYDLHKMDPETQARLGALFEAAGMDTLLYLTTVYLHSNVPLSDCCQ